MPQWIDLTAHDVTLLVRKSVAGVNELVLKRLRPDAEVPPGALAYGFEPEGEIFVRRETRFNLPEMRGIYPRAVVAEFPLEDIVYRAPEAPVPLRPAAVRPAVPEVETIAPPPGAEETFTSNAWAHIPLPRFRSEAVVSSSEGQSWVEHGGLRYPAGRRRSDDAAKEHVHRMTVENAVRMGERLPFAVLVDYPDLAYFGARKSHASTRVGKLLSQLGIAEKLMEGESGYAKLENAPYMDLVVERLPYPDGDRLVLTHYRDEGGDRILDAEMVFAIRDGRLYLKETAVENALRGGEIRGYDHYFANVFSRNLLEQGFGEAKVTWPHDPQPAPPRTEAAPAAEPDAPRVSTSALQNALAMLDAVKEGKGSVADVQASFFRLRDEKEAVLAELGKLSKVQLVERFGFFSLRDADKDKLVRRAYEALLERHTFGTMGGGLLYGSDYEANHLRAVQKAVDALIPKNLEPYVAAFVPIEQGPEAGMIMAVSVDQAGAAKLALGMSRAAASAALEEQPLSTAPGLPRQLGDNLMGHPIWEDELGRRRLRFGETVLLEGDDERGLEFLTASEAKRAGRLSLVQGAPVAGALLFGKPVFRSLEGQHYAIEHRADAEIYGFRLEVGKDGAPRWISLGEPWTQGAPSDSELRCATSQMREDAFDQRALVDEINAAAAGINADMVSERHHVKPLISEDLVIQQPDKNAYEVRLADPQIPADPVKIVREGEFWRASRGSAHSLRGPLETVFFWANRELANSRMHYLGHLHQAVDGSLRIGLPQEQFDLMRHVLLQVSRREQVQWKDLGLARCPETRIDRFTIGANDDGRLAVTIEGTALAYQLFALERDPVSTLSAYEQAGLHQLSTWLEQVDADVAWEKTVQTHPAGPLLDERVRTYLDYQVKHYGERFAARVPSPWTRATVLAITDRNLEYLLETIGRNGSSNPSTAKLFEDISGRSLGTNKASHQAAIYAYCGYSPEEAAKHAAQQAAMKRVRMLEAEAKRTIERCENFQIRHEGQVVNGKQFIDKLWGDGYSILHTTKRGAVTRYGLMNPQTRSYYDLKEPMTSYVRHLLAIRDSAQPTPAPELDDKLVPTL